MTAATLRKAPPTEVLDMLVRQALLDRASDLHIEPTESQIRVRFRIDGILHDVMALPLEMHPSIISRLKIVAGALFWGSWKSRLPWWSCNATTTARSWPLANRQ